MLALVVLVLALVWFPVVALLVDRSAGGCAARAAHERCKQSWGVL
ncbi:hypothetical protein GCM10022206_36370 [Streptomyces chiangmaiensis]